MLGRSGEQPDFSAQWVLGPSPASLPPSPSLGTLNQTIKGLCAGNIVGSVRHLLAKSSPTEERTMYRDISLLVCALQGPQFDPGAEGREPLTGRCNTIAVHVAKQHHNTLSLSTAIFFCLFQSTLTMSSRLKWARPRESIYRNYCRVIQICPLSAVFTAGRHFGTRQMSPIQSVLKRCMYMCTLELTLWYGMWLKLQAWQGSFNAQPFCMCFSPFILFLRVKFWLVCKNYDHI